MQIIQRIRKKHKRDSGDADVLTKDQCLMHIEVSLKNPSFVDGYDKWIESYLSISGGKFCKDDVLEVMRSFEFYSAFTDLERYDIELTRERSDVAKYCENAGESLADEQYDVLYHDNYTYVRDLVDSLIVYRGCGFYKMLEYEDLLCAEYGTMRTIGFVLHFIVNFAFEYDEVWDLINRYTENFSSSKAREFIEYLKEELKNVK